MNASAALATIVVLAVGSATIVALAAAVERGMRQAAAKRMVWQAACVALGLLLAVEWCGAGGAVVQLCRAAWQPADEAEIAAVLPPIATSAEPFARGATAGLSSGAEPTMPDPIVDLSGNACVATALPTHTAGQASSGTRPTPPFHPQPRASESNDFRTPEFNTTDLRIAPSGATAGLPSSAVAPGATADLPGSVDASAAGLPVWAAPWAAVVWIAVASLLAVRMIAARGLLWLRGRRYRPIGNRLLTDRVARLARQLGMRRQVDVVVVPRLTTPVAFGLLHLRVGLPAEFGEQFDEDDQDAMLMHELAHLAAADPAWHLTADLLAAALWWQPLAWLLPLRFRAVSELAADEASMLLPGGPGRLADCLVTLGRRLTEPPSRFGWAQATGAFRSLLGRRVQRLLALGEQRPRRNRPRGRVWLPTAVALMFVAIAISCTAWARPQAPLSEGDTPMSLLKHSWNHSWAGALVVALLVPLSGDTAADEAALTDVPTVEAETLIVFDDDDERGEHEGDRDREGERERDGDRERDRPREDDGERRDRDPSPEERKAQEMREVEEVIAREMRQLEERWGQEMREIEEHVEALTRERNEIVEHGGEIKRELERLPDDADDDAHELQQEINELRHRLEEINRELAEAHRAGQMHRIEGEIGKLELKKHMAAEFGREEAVHQTERRMQELRGMIERIAHGEREREHPEHRDRPREGGDLERRIRHLRAAAENLAAAGMEDQAHQLMQQAERMMHELRERGDRPREEPRERPEDHEHAEHMQHQVNALRGELHEMRQQMNEMREMMQQLLRRDR